MYEWKIAWEIQGYTQKYSSCIKRFYTILFYYFVFLQHFNREKKYNRLILSADCIGAFIAESICSRHEICYRCYGSFFYDNSILMLRNRYNHTDRASCTILYDDKITAKLCKTNSWHSAVEAERFFVNQ